MTKNRVGIRIIAFILGIMATLAFLVVNSLYDSFKWKSHTHEVKENIERVLALSIEAQTSVRGFVISKNRDFLVGYHQAVPLLMNEVKYLTDLTKDNPEQQVNCDKLATIVSNKLEILGRTLTFANLNNFDEASRCITEGEGERLIRRIKILSGDMLSIENKLLVVRQDLVERNYTYAYYGMPSLILISILVIAISMRLEN